MTPNGPCFMCGEPTGRYDDDLKRWACSVCHPEPVAWELKLLDDERRAEKARAQFKEMGEAKRQSEPWRDRKRGRR